ncbi:MAG: YihY/virulence factor BrkB family protein [Acidobacteriales bacterium]|nr:YihY/virulence factor BrkB family protein [Terriglobales bacterium]
MASSWALGGLTPLQLLKRVGQQISKDDVSGRAAQLSYYFLLALFPLLIFMVSLLGYLSGPGSELRQALLDNLSRVMPGSASELVHKTIDQVFRSRGGGKLIFGLLGALWAASAGMAALTKTLIIAYNVQETRPWWKRRSIAVGLTIAVSLLVMASLVLVLYGGRLAEFIAGHVGFGSAFVIAWRIIQWPAVLVVMLLAFGLIYYFAPNLKKPEWHWITPGAVVGLGLWLLGSLGFRIYLSYFNSYGATYGSLGALIILMLWFYISGFAVMTGGEVNSEIGRAGEEAETKRAEHRAIERELKAA